MKKQKHEHPEKAHRHIAKVHKAKKLEGKFRWIEGLRRKHKDKEIWVIGSGWSLDDFPSDFFDEFEKDGKTPKRVAIAVKFAFLAFPKAKYYQWSMINGWLSNYFKHHPELLKKCIINIRTSGKGAKTLGSAPVYMPVHNKRVFWPYYKNLAPFLLAGKRPKYHPKRYGATNTLLHWALQAAVIMGAKKITVVGCSCRVKKFQWHAMKHGMDKVYGPNGFWVKEYPGVAIPKGGYSGELMRGETQGLREIANGLIWMAKIMKPHGVEIVRYYYGKGYERIIA